MSSHSPPSRLRPHVVRHLDISSPSVWQVHECVNSTAELARIISVGLRVNGGTSDSLSHTVYNSMYVYIHSICVCDQGSEARRGRDGLLAVSVIGLLDLLISGPEAWILHSTAHLGEDFNPGKC